MPVPLFAQLLQTNESVNAFLLEKVLHKDKKDNRMHVWLSLQYFVENI